MRYLLGMAGGVLLALVLFTLLALLVAPPEDNRQVVEMPVSVSMVEAMEQQAPEPAAPASEPLPTPPSSTPPPPPAPLPSPELASDIAIPEPELPAIESPAVPQEMKLPELAEIAPEPEPQPEPRPKPEPRPEPKPQPSPTPQPQAQPTPSESLAGTGSAAASAPAASGEVGSPQPTRRVPPEYPSRALRRGIEGFVEVRFTIQPDGSVDRNSLRVVKSQPRNVFERAAMQAISRWQFPEAAGPREARQRLEFKLEG